MLTQWRTFEGGLKQRQSTTINVRGQAEKLFVTTNVIPHIARMLLCVAIALNIPPMHPFHSLQQGRGQYDFYLCFKDELAEAQRG